MYDNGRYWHLKGKASPKQSHNAIRYNKDPVCREPSRRTINNNQTKYL